MRRESSDQVSLALKRRGGHNRPARRFNVSSSERSRSAPGQHEWGVGALEAALTDMIARQLLHVEKDTGEGEDFAWVRGVRRLCGSCLDVRKSSQVYGKKTFQPIH